MTGFNRFESLKKGIQSGNIDFTMMIADFHYIKGSITQEQYDELQSLAYPVKGEQTETLGQRRIQLDLSRDQVRAAVISAWSIYEASIPQISAAQAQVEASRLALRGVIEERGVGQRTTLDVLNSQGELIDARISLVTAQRDRIVASFRIASAIGRLTSNRLDLPVARYDTKKHYKQVRDKWYGLRTPDGR